MALPFGLSDIEGTSRGPVYGGAMAGVPTTPTPTQTLNDQIGRIEMLAERISESVAIMAGRPANPGVDRVLQDGEPLPQHLMRIEEMLSQDATALIEIRSMLGAPLA